MKNLPPVLKEILFWLRGRFTLTDEEKLWLLLILVICWTGLTGRYFYVKTQQPEQLSAQEIEQLLAPQAQETLLSEP